MPENFFIKAKMVTPQSLFGISISLSKNGSKLAVGALYENSATRGINKPPAGIAECSGAVFLY